MRTMLRRAATVVGATSLLLASGAVASADTIYPSAGTSIVAGVNTVSVSSSSPGNTATVTLAVDPTGSDGKNGCNLTGSTTVTFAIDNTNAAYASVSPSSVTFDGCGATRNLTVTGLSAGTTTVSLRETANNSGGSFNVAPATFQVVVSSPCPSTAPGAPAVAVSPASASSGWYNTTTGAPTVTITPAATSPTTTQQYSVDGGTFVSGSSVTLTADGVHSLSARSVIPANGSCPQVDGTATSPVTLKVDRTAPSYTVTVPAVTGQNGWDTSDVTVSYACSDATSGLAASCPASETYTDGMTATQSTTAIFDRAGNQSANQTRRAIKVDTTIPTVTSDIGTATGDAGWDTTSFSIHYTCGDAAPVSGVASGVVDCPVDESFNQTDSPYAARTVVVHDAAGNASTGYIRREVKVDSTDPVASVVVAPAPNGAGWNNTTVTSAYTCTDAGGSALDTATCPADETFSTDGITAEKTSTVSDNAGNSTSVTRREVKVDLHAPVVTVSLEDGSGHVLTPTNGWYTQDVHVVFTCTDQSYNGVASGVQTATANACPADYTVSAEGTTPASPYDVRDVAGNATTGSVPLIRLDKTAPVLAVLVKPSDANDFGWNSSTVTVDWTCTEAGSGLAGAGCPADESYGDGDTAGARTGVTVTDLAGHVSNAVDVRAINVDTQDPTISVRLTDASDTVIAPTNGWFRQTVWVRFSCSDNGASGLRDAGTAFACPPAYSLAEGDHAGYTATIKDKADNAASVEVPEVQIDTTAPQVVVHYFAAGTTTDITPNANGWFNQDVTVHVVCTDPLSEGVASGIVAATCPADATRSQGTFSASTFTVRDLAGNTADGSVDALSIDRTNPTVSYVLRSTLAGTPVTPNGAGWFNMPVTVDFTCSDTGGSGVDDTAEAVNPCPTDLPLGEGTHASFTAGVDDKAGNHGSVEVAAVNIDTTAPVISVSSVTAKTATVGSTDWWKDGLIATFAVTENGSGLADGVPSSFTRDSSGEGSAVRVNSATGGLIVDKAGNVADDVSTDGYHIDGSAPTASVSVTSSPAYTDGGGHAWFKDSVGLSFTAADPDLSDSTPGSGLATSSGGTTTRTASGSYSVTVSDNVGHSTTSDTVSFLVDGSVPTVALDCTALPAVIHKGDAVTLPWSASDVGSGLAGATGGTLTLDTSSVTNPQPAQVAAGATSDHVGHTSGASNSCYYSVLYAWHGFFQPVDVVNNDASVGTVSSSTIFNKAKAGSAIPVKFDLGGNMGLGILAAGYPKTMQLTCSSGAVTDAIETTATANASGLIYDGTTNAPYGQYNYVWKTSTSLANTCQRLEVRLVDGTSHYAFFQFTK